MTTFSARSRRARSLAAALAAGAVVILVSGSPAEGESRSRRVVDPVRATRIQAEARWKDVISTFEAAGAKPDQFYVAAGAASVLADRVQTAGWAAPDVPALVEALTATANPDGGYGLARAWDAYQDGSVNPATTSYVATTAGHVGPVLLAGYLAGVVPANVVNRAVDSILDLPQSPGTACVPYSNSPYDLGKPCVWNVHFGAAAWVKQASAATHHRRADVVAFVARVVSVLTTVRPDPVTGYLPYSSAQTAPQDIGHQMWTSAAIDFLQANRDSMTQVVSGPLWRVQARRFRDYNVASAMSGIALFDCRYSIDPFVLAHAGSTARGNPYVYKAMAAQARAVVERCFAPAGTVRASAIGTRILIRPGLG